MERRALCATVAVVAVFAALHVAISLRLGLGVDEAHYALYARFLDWSYFDHPPMIGWLQAPVLLVSESDLALRLVPIALGVATGLLTHALARRLFAEDSPWTAFVAVALIHSAGLFHLIFVGAVPEAPLLVFALATMLVLHRVMERPRPATWLALGLLLGLAGLSKYTAVTLAATCVGALLFHGRARLLSTPGPWMAIAAAALLVSPVVLWNASHDWISFRYQMGHGTGGEGWSPTRLLVSQAAQLAAWGPGLYLFTYLALVAGWRERRRPGVGLTLLLVLPVLALFAWGSGFESGLPHWTALVWVGASPLTARWLLRSWRSRRVRVATWSAGSLSAIALVVVHTHALFLWLPLPDFAEPYADLVCWREAALRADALREAMAEEEGREPRLFVDNWHRASRIAWYARPTPVAVVDDRFDQFDLWFGSPEVGDRGVLVTWSARAEPRPVDDLERFARTELLEQLPVSIGDRRVATFRFYACEGYRDGLRARAE